MSGYNDTDQAYYESVTKEQQQLQHTKCVVLAVVAVGVPRPPLPPAHAPPLSPPRLAATI
jgi:hypothetical protein